MASAHWPLLGFWFLLLAPVVAGGIYGPLVHRFAPEARGHGVPEVMYAVSHRGGRIAPQVTLVKALASAPGVDGDPSIDLDDDDAALAAYKARLAALYGRNPNGPKG